MPRSRTLCHDISGDGRYDRRDTGSDVAAKHESRGEVKGNPPLAAHYQRYRKRRAGGLHHHSQHHTNKRKDQNRPESHVRPASEGVKDHRIRLKVGNGMVEIVQSEEKECKTDEELTPVRVD